MLERTHIIDAIVELDSKFTNTTWEQLHLRLHGITHEKSCCHDKAVCVNLPGWCWAEIQQFALVGSSSSLHSEACNALGASDGVIHSRISLEVVCFWASTNEQDLQSKLIKHVAACFQHCTCLWFLHEFSNEPAHVLKVGCMIAYLHHLAWVQILWDLVLAWPLVAKTKKVSTMIQCLAHGRCITVFTS